MRLMQIAKKTRSTSGLNGYRERLGPSLWFLVSAAIVGPMAALVLVPLGPVVAIFSGVGVAAAAVLLLVGVGPVVRVDGDELRAGRAHIPVSLLGTARVLTGDDARAARGAGLDARAWHLVRGGIDGLVIVPVTDQDDPVTSWVISSRTPERLAAALTRAQRQAG